MRENDMTQNHRIDETHDDYTADDETGDLSRRDVLRGGAGLAGLLALPATTRRVSATESYQTLEIIDDPHSDKVSVYFFSVSGDLQATGNSAGDSVGAYDGWGRVGPTSGTDTFKFRGEVTAFQIAGPATVKLNGAEVDPWWDFPHYVHEWTPADINGAKRPDSETGWYHTIQFTNPEGITGYEMECGGLIQSTEDSAKDMGYHAGYSASSVMSHIGPDAGTDTYRFHGNMTHFELVGKCDVYVDGNKVTPGESEPMAVEDGRQWTLVFLNTVDEPRAWKAIVRGDVTGSRLESGDTLAPQSDGTTVVSGELGNLNDHDQIDFTGALEAISFDADVACYVDGEPVSEEDYPAA